MALSNGVIAVFDTRRPPAAQAMGKIPSRQPFIPGDLRRSTHGQEFVAFGLPTFAVGDTLSMDTTQWFCPKPVERSQKVVFGQLLDADTIVMTSDGATLQIWSIIRV
jgi:hypothetical protein